MTVLCVLGRAEQGLVNNVLGHVANELGVTSFHTHAEHPEVELWAWGRGVPVTVGGALGPDRGDFGEVLLVFPSAFELPAVKEAQRRQHPTLFVHVAAGQRCSPPTYTLEDVP